LNDSQNELQNKIKEAVRNHEQIHVHDEWSVDCNFHDLIKQNGRLDVEEIDSVINELPSDYSEFTRDHTWYR